MRPDIVPPRETFFSNRELLILAGLLIGIMTTAALIIRAFTNEPDSWTPGDHWSTSVVLCQALHAAIILIYKPQALWWSKWGINIRWAVIALGLGVVIGYTSRRIFGIDSEGIVNNVAHVIWGPILEEFFLRGIALRSLRSRYDSKLCILMIAIIAGLVHPDFWSAFAAQAIFGTIYIYGGNNLSQSMLCHIVTNALVTL